MYITGSQLKDNIKRAANSRGYSINSLCDNINLTRNGFDYSINNMTIKLKTIIDIANFLNVDYKQLIESDFSPKSIISEDTSNYGRNYKEKYYELLEENRELRKRIDELKSDNNKKKEAS